jgi:hypothetical protein
MDQEYCGKIRYQSRADAARASLTITRREIRRKRRYDPYYCPICNAWHLTTRRKRIP